MTYNMKYIITAVIVMISFSACGTDPVTRIADVVDPPANTLAPIGQEDSRSDWSDGNEGPPNYPTTNEARSLLGDAWSQYTRDDRQIACSYFWSVEDQTIVNEMEGNGYNIDQVHAWLNILWENC